MSNKLKIVREIQMKCYVSSLEETRGRRGSNAAKSHNANKLFLIPQAARAHPGDNSRIVSIVLSESRFNQLFNGGAVEAADLRHFS